MNPFILMGLKAAHEKASKALAETKPERLKEAVVAWVSGLPAPMLHEKATSALRFVGTLIKGKP